MQTVTLSSPPRVIAGAAVGGKQEAMGPLGKYLDHTEMDSFFGEKTWEKGESAMQKMALRTALEKAKLQPEDIDFVFGGDLLNQCIGSAFALREFGIPYYGLYGACSTMGEGLALAALMVNAGYAKRAAAITSSHFCTAERQYRMPVPYGSQRPPTAQWTATASGCAILAQEGEGPHITHVCCGRVVDLGITDANNMGAAMAPAACDTLTALFRDTGTRPEDYDRIFTGDLGALGHRITSEEMARRGYDMEQRYLDCGMMLYDRKAQDMHMGASGCGCSAAVFNAYLLTAMKEEGWKRIIFAPTGALLSPTSSFQGESIPGICHAVVVAAEGGI